MRRTPLKRSPMRRRKRSTTYSRRDRDSAFMLFVKGLPCWASNLGPCEGEIEADHAGARGMSQKADDRTCIPLCTGHHRGRTDFSGPFKLWDKASMRMWLLDGQAYALRMFDASSHCLY